MIAGMNEDYSDNNPHLATLYPAHLETVRQRHDHALENAGANHAVIFSGSPRIVFLDDMPYAFKPNAHFVSWAPLASLPLSYIVYTPGETPRLIYYQPRDYWHVVPGEPDGYWTAHFDVRVVHTIDDIGDHLPEDRSRCILIGEINDNTHAFGIDRINPTTAINILHYGRGIKTDYEVACMRLSAQRGVRGHIAAEAAFRDGQSEFEIHRAFCQAVSHTDAEFILSLDAAPIMHDVDCGRRVNAVNANHAVIFSGSPRIVFLDDMPYAFKPNAHFVSWAPLASLPLSYIVYTPGDTPRLIYYQPRDYWHVVPGEPDGFWTARFDVDCWHE